MKRLFFAVLLSILSVSAFAFTAAERFSHLPRAMMVAEFGGFLSAYECTAVDLLGPHAEQAILSWSDASDISAMVSEVARRYTIPGQENRPKINMYYDVIEDSLTAFSPEGAKVAAAMRKFRADAAARWGTQP